MNVLHLEPVTVAENNKRARAALALEKDMEIENV